MLNIYILYKYMLHIWIGQNILPNTKVILGHLGTMENNYFVGFGTLSDT